MNLPSDMAHSPKLGFGSHPPPPPKQDTQLLYQHKLADETPTTEEEITAAKLRSKKWGAPPTTQMAKGFRGDGKFSRGAGAARAEMMAVTTVQQRCP